MRNTSSFSQPDDAGTSVGRPRHTAATTILAAAALLAATTVLTAGAFFAGAAVARAPAGPPTPGTGAAAPDPWRPRQNIPGPVRIAHVPAMEPASDTLVVQNVGRTPSRAVVAWFGDECPTCCAAPVAVTSSPPLRPGSSWPFVPPTPSARYATVFSLLNRVDGLNLGCRDPRCYTRSLVENLKERLPGSCTEYRRFAKAFAEGLNWGYLPLDMFAGPSVAAWAERSDGAGDSAVAWRRDSGDLGSYDPQARGYRYLSPLVTAESTLAIQNAGLESMNVSVTLIDPGDMPRLRSCRRMHVGAASRGVVGVGACVPAGWRGGAVIATSGPAAVQVMDPAGAYGAAPGLPAAGPLAIYGLAPRDVVPLTVPLPGVADGALIAIQNSSETKLARVHVTFLSPQGYAVGGTTTLVAPGGITHLNLDESRGEFRGPIASARLVSQAIPEGSAPSLAVVARLGPTGVLPAIQGPPAADWPPADRLPGDPWLVDNTGRRWHGNGLLAIPDLRVPADPAQRASLYALNTATVLGKTWLVWQVYDANGLVGAFCDSLYDGESAYYPVDRLFLAPGFRGTAFLSATMWEHDLFSSTGVFVGNQLGLAAGIVRRDADGSVHTAPAIGYQPLAGTMPPAEGDETNRGGGPPCPFRGGGRGGPPREPGRLEAPATRASDHWAMDDQ